MLSFLATGSLERHRSQGLNELNQQYQRKYGRGQSYLPPVEAIYWSMRGMAYSGTLVFADRGRRRVPLLAPRLEKWRWFLWVAVAGRSCPFVAATFGWLLTELGRQPWIVQGLLQTADANSPAVSTTWLAISLTVVRRALPRAARARHRADAALRERRPDRLRRRGGGAGLAAGGRLLMDLQIFWFILIGVLWGGYFLLEGFDFGVGMLLPVLPRDERERGYMFRTIGPVWDGNEVWLVVAGGATFAAFPAWYATMFSGFYIALLLLLFFLIIRVLSFEWRAKAKSPRWRTAWLWCNTIGSLGASLIWGVAFSALLYGVPINSSGDFSGDVLGPVQPVHAARGRRGRAALRLPRGDVPHAAHDRRPVRAGEDGGALALGRGGRRGRGLPRIDGRGRGQPQRQGRLPADPARRGGDPGARPRGRLRLHGGEAPGRSR